MNLIRLLSIISAHQDVKREKIKDNNESKVFDPFSKLGSPIYISKNLYEKKWGTSIPKKYLENWKKKNKRKRERRKRLYIYIYIYIKDKNILEKKNKKERKKRRDVDQHCHPWQSHHYL